MSGPCTACGGRYELDATGVRVAHRAPCGAWCGAAPYGLAAPVICPLHVDLCRIAPRPPCAHELKTHVAFFERMADGSKTFEIRRNDRDFREGDEIILREYDPEVGYLGRSVRRRITFLMVGYHALRDGFVAMGLAPCDGPGSSS